MVFVCGVESLSHLANLWCQNVEQEFYNGLSAISEENLEVFNHKIPCRVAFDTDGEHILLNLWHRLLALELFILFAKHDLAVLLKLWVLLQILVYVHHLLCLWLTGQKILLVFLHSSNLYLNLITTFKKVIRFTYCLLL